MILDTAHESLNRVCGEILVKKKTHVARFTVRGSSRIRPFEFVFGEILGG